MLSEPQAPDLEELAAFVDGRLSGERKARVEERLLRDEDYYEVFLETVRFQEEHRQGEHGEKEPGEVIRGPDVWWRRPRFVAPMLAAAAVLVLAVAGLLRLLGGDWAAQLDAAAVVAQGEGWDDPGWSRTRSGEGGWSRYRPEQQAFRFGARTVDLRLARAAGDRETAKRLVAQLSQHTADAGFFAVAAAYEGGDVEAAERYLRESLEGLQNARFFALGQWAEAGRLAALSRDAEALRRIVRRDPDARSVEEIAPQVETLKTLVRSPAPDFAQAVKTFEEIIDVLAG